MRIPVVVAILFLAVRAALGAQVSAVLYPQDAQVGDTLRLDLRVRDLQGQPVSFPRDLGSSFEVIRVDSTQLAAQGLWRYVIAAFDTGKLILSDLPVLIGRAPQADTLLTPAVTVNIRSLLASTPDSNATVRPLKPYREQKFQWRELLDWWWLPAVLAFGLVVWWVWRRFFRPRTAEEVAAEIYIPPHEEAIRDLIALKDKRYPARGMLKEFYTEFSLIMRRYLERRYEFPALETTTFDLERELEDSRYPGVLNERLLPTLREADLVKFAKFEPDYSRCDTLVELGFELVILTKPQLESPVAEEKAA
jgi:hypothetical protein